ncbi:MAG: site-specific integrase, partial [Acidobacteria bacterium]|nr:site-specific integrase [Acidobacteriota bacterium]
MTAHLQAFLQFLKLNRNVSPHTARAYASDLSQFIAHTAAGAGVTDSDLDPAQLDRAAVRSFLAEIHRQGQSRATAARKLAAVRTFLKYLRREEIITIDPGALIRTPQRDVRMPAHLSEDEMSRLIAAASSSTPLGRRDRAILELFYASGLRLSELTGLDVEHVNLSAKMVRVLGKGGKQRIVPFNASTAAALRVYLRDREALVRQDGQDGRDGQDGQDGQDRQD